MSDQIRCTSCGELVQVTETDCPNCGTRVELVDRSKTIMVIGALLLPLTVGGVVGALNHGALDAQFGVFLVIALVGPSLLAVGYHKRNGETPPTDAGT